MKKKIIITITTILIWIVVIIPAMLLLNECIDSYFNGTYHGFAGEELLYGIPAFLDTLGFYVLFFFPVSILWFIIFMIAIALTVVTIIVYCRKNNEK